MRSVGLGLSLLLMLTTAACFRPASEAAQSSETIPTSTVDASIVDVPTQSPTSDANAVVIPTFTADVQVAIETPATPSIVPTLTESSNNPAPLATLTPTSAQPTPNPDRDDLGTPTVIFITPGSPLGFITPETSVPNRLPTLSVRSAESTDESGFALTSEPSATPTQENACTYIVQAGDTLYQIALDQEIDIADIRAANPDLTGTNPVLQIDQELFMPRDGCPGFIERTDDPDATDEPENTPRPPGSEELYVVQPGDTLSSIAARFGTTISELSRANALTNPDQLSVGQELIIPASDE
jgi:LysM repeat protein